MATKLVSTTAPTPETKPDTRDLLLAAASALMRERDSLDVSLADIGHRAGVNAALVRYYFGNKNGMQIALIGRDLDVAMLQLSGLLAMDLTATKKMRMHLSGLIRIYFQYPYLNRLMHAAMRSGSEDTVRHVADKYLIPIAAAYDRLLSDGLKAGEFKQYDPKLFYFAVIGACDQIFSAGYVLKYVHGIDGIDDNLRHAYAKQITTLVMDGLRP